MERIFLCLLCLSGWSVSSCLSRWYHYVNDPMTWTEAQTYCRQKHTDLATVGNMEEMDKLNSTVPSDESNSSVWIGLYSKIQWKWSDGYNGSGSDYRNWVNFEPGDQLCVDIDGLGKWWDYQCNPLQPSVCYNGTQQDPEFVFVNDRKNWSDAQRNCRENYVDLATVRNHTENQKILRLLQGDYAWIGLHREPDLFWSDGGRFSFQFWNESQPPLHSVSVVCGAADSSDSRKWNLRPCEEKYPFVCYGTKIKRQVIKLRMKPGDSSLNLNNPAVKAGLLRELQDRLKKSGLSGVTLKWREQRDGKVFHRERESSQKKNRKKTEL